jgi:hypothetical protein
MCVIIPFIYSAMREPLFLFLLYTPLWTVNVFFKTDLIVQSHHFDISKDHYLTKSVPKT